MRYCLLNISSRLGSLTFFTSGFSEGFLWEIVGDWVRDRHVNAEEDFERSNKSL